MLHPGNVGSFLACCFVGIFLVGFCVLRVCWFWVLIGFFFTSSPLKFRNLEFWTIITKISDATLPFSGPTWMPSCCCWVTYFEYICRPWHRQSKKPKNSTLTCLSQEWWCTKKLNLLRKMKSKIKNARKQILQVSLCI